RPVSRGVPAARRALRGSPPAMYLRAGLLDSEGQQGVLAAIAVDPELTIAQKQALSQIYETFRNENKRQSPPPAEEAADLAEEDTLVARMALETGAPETTFTEEKK